MGHVLRGFKLLFKTPGLWPMASAPLVIASIAYVLVLVLGFSAVVPRMTEWVAGLGLPEGVGWVTGSTLFAVVWVFVSGPLFLVAFCTVAVFAWDKLSRGVEIAVNGTAPALRLSASAILVDIAVRVFIAVTAGIVILVLGMVGLGLVGALIAGWMLLYDLTAATYARRGFNAFGQSRFVHHCPGWISFWLTGAVLSLIPGLNVLFLPAFVVGATLMVLDSERKTPEVSPAP